MVLEVADFGPKKALHDINSQGLCGQCLAPGLIDAALIALFVGYALAVLNLGRSGPDALDEARFDSAIAAHRALVTAAAALCLSALFDLAVLLDFLWSRGANAPHHEQSKPVGTVLHRPYPIA
ncbi:hypothetical protein M2281_005664 [Mesorhizobium soli]|nr:hypothetical protein [Mesorhizobium soli]